MLLLILKGCFKKADIQFWLNNVLHNEDEESRTLKAFHPTPEHTDINYFSSI